MYIPPNYLEDVNSFKLAGPPLYFRRALWEFDPSLVVVPSRMGFFYRLAQHRKPSLTTAIVNEATFNESDTKMLASYNLIPVTTILATANWGNPLLLEELRRRAPWRLGGAEKVSAEVEAEDAKKEMDIQIKNDEMLTDLSKDAWGLYLKKIGLRSHMWIPKTEPSTSAPRPPKSAAIKVGSIFLP